MYNYNPYVSKRNITRKNDKSSCVKTVVIALLAMAIVFLLGVIVNLKRTYSLREYSITNNCSWVYQNTAYGDDRDYICK